MTELVQCMNLCPNLTEKSYTAKGWCFGSEIIWNFHCSRCKQNISTGTLGFILGTAGYIILFHHGLEPKDYDTDLWHVGCEKNPSMWSHPKFYNNAKDLILKVIADITHPVVCMPVRCSCGICELDNDEKMRSVVIDNDDFGTSEFGTSDYLKEMKDDDFLLMAHRRHLEMSNFLNALKMDAYHFQYSSSTISKALVNILKKEYTDTFLYCLFGRCQLGHIMIGNNYPAKEVEHFKLSEHLEAFCMCEHKQEIDTMMSKFELMKKSILKVLSASGQLPISD